MKPGTAIGKAIAALLASGRHSATVYLADKLTVKATRIRYKGKPTRGVFEARLTVGRPNAAARKFIKLAQRAGEPFPIRKVQLTGKAAA